MQFNSIAEYVSLIYVLAASLMVLLIAVVEGRLKLENSNVHLNLYFALLW